VPEALVAHVQAAGGLRMQEVSFIFYDLLSSHYQFMSCHHVSRCRNKIHKEHVDKHDPLAPCKLNHDPRSARDMLLLAASPEDQSLWVARLLKRIQKSGYKANSSNNNSTDGSKISPR